MLRVQKVPTRMVSLKLLKISIFLRTNSMGDLNCVIKSTVGRTLDLIDQKVKKESATAVLLIFYSNWQSKHRIWSIDFLFVFFPQETQHCRIFCPRKWNERITGNTTKKNTLSSNPSKSYKALFYLHRS